MPTLRECRHLPHARQ